MKLQCSINYENKVSEKSVVSMLLSPLFLFGREFGMHVLSIVDDFRWDSCCCFDVVVDGY